MEAYNYYVASQNETNPYNFGDYLGGAFLGIFSPVISILALPILAIKYGVERSEYRKLKAETLGSEGKREKFGRVQGQDYTRWDGKARDVITKEDRLHHSINHYPRFPDCTKPFPADCPFNTTEDKVWLEKEEIRLKQKEKCQKTLNKIKSFAKALIPIGGMIWVLASRVFKTDKCTVCGIEIVNNTHHTALEAITHHAVYLELNQKTN